MAEIKSLLDEAIETEIQDLKNQPNGEKKSEKIRDIAALHKLRIEEIKAKTEADDKEQRRLMEDKHHDEEIALKKEQRNDEVSNHEHDEEYRQRQLKDQAIDRYVKIGVAVAELTVPLVFYGIWMCKGFRFEETGSFTSTTFKNLINRFRPTKKG